MEENQKKEMAKAYQSQEAERKWYEFWEHKGYFTPEADPNRKPFTIIMPPSNVTGELHLGHALVMSIEDTFTRWHRMMGDITLWLPGTDHAGIAGQYVVEKELAKEGKTRHDLGRDEFLKRVWAWMDKYGGIINQQIRHLGASCDWTRERFTLDEGLSRAVREAFVRLFEAGLADLVAPAGTLVLSGILAEQAEEVKASAEQHGLKFKEMRQIEDWVALAFTSPN